MDKMAKFFSTGGMEHEGKKPIDHAASLTSVNPWRRAKNIK